MTRHQWRLAWRLAMRLGALLLVPAMAGAQRATILGRVVVKTTDLPLGFAMVALVPSGAEQFAGGDGRFTIRDVRAGRVTVSAKHIGYTPLDTTFTVAAGDTVRLQLEMSLITVRLPAIHSFAQGCAHPGASTNEIGLELAVLLEQVKENAERNRLLSRSYPFETVVERRVTRPEPVLEARFVAYDTVRHPSERPWRYAPGKMLGSRDVDGGVFGGRWVTITIPQLADYADERFLNSHCFDFGGVDRVGGDSLLRIEFVPAATIRDPDVSGSIFLDMKTYQLRLTLVALENLAANKQLREQIEAQTIRATFKEIVPGVPVLDVVSSTVYPKTGDKDPPTEPSTEIQRLLSVRFLRIDPRP